MIINNNILEAVAWLKRGEIIAYPTEAVYGLGCNPFDQNTVMRLLELKQRRMSKGFILIASNWRQVEALVQPIGPKKLTPVLASWPGPTTWIFPATTNVPPWISAIDGSIAIRITNHPQARELCEKYQSPLISTSANLSGEPPARNSEMVVEYFDGKIPFLLEGKVGGLANPTMIRVALSGRILRG
jgi:L-threonylcarbamoyladenylate synthase